MTWRYISRGFTIVFLTLLVGVGIGSAAVRLHGGKLLSVQTGSMTPIIRKGDLVIVTRVPERSLKIGDVVTYINPANTKQTITHRITQTPNLQNRGKFIVKGDANPAPDKPVKPSAIVGKVNYHLPYLGRAVDLVRKPLGLILIVYVPALAIVIEELRRLINHYKRQQPYVVAGFKHDSRSKNSQTILNGTIKFVLIASISFLLFAAVHVYALLKSNPVTLTNNHISATKVVPPTCTTGSNNTNITITGSSGGNNNVNVSNSNNQSSSTGNSTTNGGGTATSGNASNTNCTNINVTITNH